MRSILYVMAAGVILTQSCDSGPTDVVPTRFTRTLSKVQCTLSGGPGNDTPCIYFSSASNTDYVDSGRVVFNNDNSVQYMLGTHRNGAAPTVTNQTGTYSIVADTVLLHLGQATLRLRGALPDRVPSDWPGPDSLECINCVSNNFATLIFKTP